MALRVVPDQSAKRMDHSLQTQIETYLLRLDGLMRRGRQLRDALTADPSNASVIASTRAWQEECGVTVNQLSGGSKAHWLARKFSEAFLMRSESGQAVAGAAPGEIVERLIGVLAQAVASLSKSGREPLISSSTEAAPRRFEFVHDTELKPILEQAYRDSRSAFERGDYELAMRISCGILEAIVTDALEHKGVSARGDSGAPAGKIVDWPFETRLAVAEKIGLIRGGCARLPEMARRYRDHSENATSVVAVSERDARVTAQVLNVVMRDLNPGR